VNTVELLEMSANSEESEVAFALKRDALGPHIIAKWGWEETYQRSVHAERWNSKRFFRIVRGGATIGTVAVDEQPDHIRVGEFYVAPAHQNQGVGAAVLRPILLDAAERKLPVRLECLKWNPALSFYKRHGFVVTGESEIHFFMERSPSRNDS
jgi:ribosomal protein S18 acetylase RimI-like enzyme